MCFRVYIFSCDDMYVFWFFVFFFFFKQKTAYEMRISDWSSDVCSSDLIVAHRTKLLSRDDVIYYPAHGEPVENPQRWVRSMMGHRKHREGQIMRHLRDRKSVV